MGCIIKENRESTYINYILENEDIFFNVGYKVLQNHENNGFVRCAKILHNGKIKLVYDISKFKDLETLIHTISTDSLIKVISKLLRVIIDVKENGFIEYKHINANLNTIFVDTNNLNIKLIYIPVNIENGKNEKIFLDELRTNILDSINASSHSGLAINKLRLGLNNNNNNLQDILNDINSNIDSGQYVRSNFSNKEQVTPKPVVIEHVQPKEISKENHEVNRERKSYISSLGSIFSRKNGVKKEEKQPVRRIEISNDDYDETNLISEDDMRTIALKSVNMPADILINISGDKFIIGSSKDFCDGIISSNKAISRRHCCITFNNQLSYISDLGSSNGTFINGNRLERDKNYEIRVGDRVKIANSEFVIIEN